MADDFKALIAKVATGASLTREESANAFDRMMSGEATPSQMGGLLMALRVRGETVDEITGAVTTMRAKMLGVEAPPDAVDVVGTGGDASGSYNISTCAAFIVAGAGVPVAKHGNRALSSNSGAADVLGALGVKIDLPPDRSALHPRGRHRLHVRAGASSGDEACRPDPRRARHPHHLQSARARSPIPPASSGRWSACSRGTGSSRWRRCCKNLGSESVWVVHGSDGLDEITTTGPTHVAALENGEVRTFEITPEDVGLPRAKPEALRGGDAEHNAKALLDVLKGKKGAFRDVAMLNAAAALMVAGKAKDLKEGAALAREVDRQRRGARRGSTG